MSQDKQGNSFGVILILSPEIFSHSLSDHLPPARGKNYLFSHHPFHTGSHLVLHSSLWHHCDSPCPHFTSSLPGVSPPEVAASSLQSVAGCSAVPRWGFAPCWGWLEVGAGSRFLPASPAFAAFPGRAPWRRAEIVSAKSNTSAPVPAWLLPIESLHHYIHMLHSG